MKKERETVISQLQKMSKLKNEREKQFSGVIHQLQNISSELYGSTGFNAYLDEKILSVEKLEDLKRQLVQFQKEKVIFVSSPVLFAKLPMFLGMSAFYNVVLLVVIAWGCFR